MKELIKNMFRKGGAKHAVHYCCILIKALFSQVVLVSCEILRCKIYQQSYHDLTTAAYRGFYLDVISCGLFQTDSPLTCVVFSGA